MYYIGLYDLKTWGYTVCDSIYPRLYPRFLARLAMVILQKKDGN
jgi:hypothetical protein